MVNIHSPIFTYASTDAVAVEGRLAYWDQYNAGALIGLRTSSSSNSGLSAHQANGRLDTMDLAEIAGNDHVIERDTRLINDFPKDSVFACHLVEGNAYFIQGGECQTLFAHDTIIYDTRRPFTFGFLTDMRELLVEIPVSELSERWNIRADDLPFKVVPAQGVASAVGAEFRRVLTGYLKNPSLENANSVPTQTHMLLKTLVRSCQEGASGLDASLFYVLAAKSHIAMNLSDGHLTPSSVARKVGVSVRHLNRLFSTDRTPLSEYIWSERTARAHRDLVANAERKVSIGEIAFRWGFSSQSHFCRTIVARYRMTPSEIMRQPVRDLGVSQPPSSPPGPL